MKQFKHYQFFLLLFCIFNTSTANAEYKTHATETLYVHGIGNHINNRPGHSNFSYNNNTFSNPGFDRSSPNRHQFKGYTAQDFQKHFTAHGYTENHILNQRCLYMFDEFVKFAQTHSAYTCTMQQLHAELKNLNIWQRAYYTIKGTYCPGLQKRIQYLYNQLDTLKQQPVTYTEPVVKFRDVSLEKFQTQIPEYNTLQNIYQAHTPSLSNAIDKRLQAYTHITTTDYALQYASKSYNLNNNAQQLLSKYNHNTARFTECFGNQLHQTIHQESLDLLNRIDHISPNSLLYDHQEALVDFTVAMVDYNHEGHIDKATYIADFCWTLLDYGQAVAEGAALGVYSAATDLINNPIEATINIFAGKQVLAYQLSKVLYNVADISVTAITNYDHAKNKWDKYTAPLNNIIDAINKKEITLRDVVKNGTALVVGYKTQGKLLGGLGKFCNTIKQKSVSFIQKNISLTPGEYLTTPEGLLFKATAQSDKLKQAGKAGAENLKNGIDNKIANTDNIKNNTPLTKPVEASNAIASKGIIRNVTENLRSTIAKYEQHIFSPEHKRDGILTLGKNQETIMDSLYNVIISVDKKGLLQEGNNQIKTIINGIDNVEIRCFIKNGEAISTNAFISKFGRTFDNFIDTTKI